MNISDGKDQSTKTPSSLTERGNPASPNEEGGEEMLLGMNVVHQPVTVWGLGHFTYDANDRILDVGCGGGAALAYVRTRVPGGFLAGIDHSAVAVRLASHINADDIEDGTMEILEASVEAIPYADASFDKVFTIESFYFWPDAVGCLKEVCRVLKPGGRFLLIADVYDNGDLPEADKENIRKFNMRVPTIDAFKDMFEKAGFSETLIHTGNKNLFIAVEGIK